MRLFIIPVLLLLLVACVPQGELSGNDTGAPATIPPTAPEAPTAPVETPDTAAPVEAAPAVPEKPAIYTVEGTEGDMINLKPEAIDPDGDKILYSFTLPFNKEGRWQTKIGDEGKYTITVGASDGKSTTTENVLVVVKRANRAPTVECKSVVVNEGEQVDLHQSCTVADEDDTEVVVMYGGWMSSWRYTTTFEDAGTHTVTITASDKRKGEVLHTVIKDVTVTVKNVNRAPVFTDDFPTLVTGIENDVITLPKLKISDPDGDKVTVTYSAPFGPDGVWKTKIGDAGTYDVDVVATDGEVTAKKTVTIKIGLLNTAPTLKKIGSITVKEGETVKIPVSATDREGDKLTTTISGWMTADSYKTTYEDAGSYTVKVSVTDGEFTTDEIVTVTVVDQNRPPVFVTPA
jgi:hypothetical protein